MLKEKSRGIRHACKSAPGTESRASTLPQRYGFRILKVNLLTRASARSNMWYESTCETRQDD